MATFQYVGINVLFGKCKLSPLGLCDGSIPGCLRVSSGTGLHLQQMLVMLRLWREDIFGVVPLPVESRLMGE